MIFLRSLVFNFSFIVWTIVLAVCVIVLPRHVSVAYARLWARGSLRLLRVVCGIRWELRGHEHIPDGPFIVASKHQSAWETLAFWIVFAHPVFILKKELLRIPLFGQALAKTGMIAIDRKAGTSALKKMDRDCTEVVQAGRPVIIFPEGTRIPPGDKRPYHRGVARLYKALEVPVLPVALNSGYFWSKNAFVKKPGTIVMKLLPPIAPGLDTDTFMLALEEQIEGACETL